MSDNRRVMTVVPAQAGTQWRSLERPWITAPDDTLEGRLCAGMSATMEYVVTHSGQAISAQNRARKPVMPYQKSAVAPSVLWSLPGTTCQLFGPAHAS